MIRLTRPLIAASFKRMSMIASANKISANDSIDSGSSHEANTAGSIKRLSDEMEISPEMNMHNLQFARNTSFFGVEGQHRIENAHVVIVGLGGVGSHAAHMLARSGVGNFIFIDYDVVTVSSLNRHSVAVRNDIGKPKAEIMRDHILEFNPDAQITAHIAPLSKENISKLIPTAPDFVVDCIDDYSTKADVLEYCIRHDIKVISSMGSGCRSNPTSLLITNITDVKYDPLAAKIRHELKKRGIQFDCEECANPTTNEDPMKPMVVNTSTGVYIPCVSSYEKPVVKILSYEDSRQGKVSEESVMKHTVQHTDVDTTGLSSLRYRTIPVYACVPAAFGNAICSYILHSLAQKPYRPSAAVPLSQDIVLKMYNSFLAKEKKLYNNTDVPLDRFDIMFLVQSVFHQKSVFSGRSIAGAKLELTRWDASKLPTLENVVLGTAEECRKHESEKLEGMDPNKRTQIQNVLDTLVSQEARNACYYWDVC